MARKSMTKTAKAATNVDTEEVAVQTVEKEEKPKRATKRAPKKVKREFKETDGILCRSVTSGKLIMVGRKTGMKYEWGDYGREYEVEYRDLVIAVRTRSDFVFGPLFIIEDDDFLEEFPIVKKFYDESYNVDELNEIIHLPVEEMKMKLCTLPPVAEKNFLSLAAKAVTEKKLDSLEKIRTLDEMYGINLMLLSEG